MCLVLIDSRLKNVSPLSLLSEDFSPKFSDNLLSFIFYYCSLLTKLAK